MGAKGTVLFVSCNYKSTGYDFCGLKRSFLGVIPLAPYILAGLTPGEMEVQVSDISDVHRHYTNENISLVAFSANLTPSVPAMYKASGIFHGAGIPVVWGGIHPSSVPDEVLDSGCVDAIVVGQGEGVWQQIVEDARKGELRRVYYGSPSAVEFGPQEGYPSYTADRENHLGRASPDWSFLDKKPIILPVETTRGCNNRCPPCSAHRVTGQVFQMKDPSLVRTEVREALFYSLLPYIAFADNNISQDPKYLEEIMNTIAPIGARYICMGALKPLMEYEPAVYAMQGAGIDTLCIGFETLTQGNLLACDKEVSDYENGIRLLHRHKIGVLGSFMIGLDGDSVETVREILAFSDRVGIDLMNINVVTPFPGTGLQDRLADAGRIEHLDYREYDCQHAVIGTPNMDRGTLQAAYDELRRKAYSPARVMQRVFSTHGTLLTKGLNLFELVTRKRNDLKH